MTLAHPLLLLAGISLPILWLLARRAKRRRGVVVASLLLWDRIGLTPEPPRERARRADRLLLLRMLAAALATLGMAGPEFGPAAPPAVLPVLLDVSSSMEAFRAEAEAALGRIREAAGVAVEIHRLPGTADLAALLSRYPGGTVVVVTDHEIPGVAGDRRARLFLVGHEVRNVGIVAASVAEGAGGEPEFTAVVRNYGPAAVAVTVTSPAGERTLDLGAGEGRAVTGPAPGGQAGISIRPGGDFAFDDRVTVKLLPPARKPLRADGELEPHLALALRAGGLLAADGGPGAVSWRREPGPDAAIVVAPPGARRGIAGTLAVVGDIAPEAVPDPATPLGSVSALLPADATPLLTDAEGPLAVYSPSPAGGCVTVALDPGDPASSWAMDPSFPVFFAEVGRLLGFAPGGSIVTSGVIDEEESATRGVSGPADLEALVPSRSDGPPATFAPGWLMLAAAGVLVLLHALVEAAGGRSEGIPVKEEDVPGR